MADPEVLVCDSKIRFFSKVFFPVSKLLNSKAIHSIHVTKGIFTYIDPIKQRNVGI